MKTTERWIAEPSEENRQAAFKAAEELTHLHLRESPRWPPTTATPYPSRRSQDERKGVFHYREARHRRRDAGCNLGSGSVKDTIQRLRNQRR